MTTDILMLLQSITWSDSQPCQEALSDMGIANAGYSKRLAIPWVIPLLIPVPLLFLPLILHTPANARELGKPMGYSASGMHCPCDEPRLTLS
jgi:hypothetical protein